MFLGSVMVLSATNLRYDNITCFGGVSNSQCLAMGTYAKRKTDDTEIIMDLIYYHFTPLFLGSMWFFSSVPYWAWRWSDDSVSKISSRGQNIEPSTPAGQRAVEKMTKIFVKKKTLFLVKFICFEILSAVVYVFQVYATHNFLHGKYFAFGQNILTTFNKRNIENASMTPVDFYFPSVSNCNYQIPGPSGTMQSLNGECYLHHHPLIAILFIIILMNQFIHGVVYICEFLYYLLNTFPKIRAVMAEENEVSIVRNSFADWLLLGMVENLVPDDVFDKFCETLEIKK